MRYQFSKEIYLKEALIKTAYGFTDKAYLHMDKCFTTDKKCQGIDSCPCIFFDRY